MLIKGGANKGALKGLFVREVPIIRTQRKRKKRCISANQEGWLSLGLEGGGIE
jgi:hypothetical protein